MFLFTLPKKPINNSNHSPSIVSQKDLGIPTANLDGEEVKNLKLLDGIYFGWAKILNDPARENNVYPMSASIGNNPTYGSNSQ